MSHSYKHTPISKDGDRRKKPFKKMANRAVRQRMKNPTFEMDIKGRKYKRLFPSWDIADYICYWSKEEAIKDYYEKYERYEWFREKYPTLDLFLKTWEKSMRRK